MNSWETSAAGNTRNNIHSWLLKVFDCALPHYLIFYYAKDKASFERKFQKKCFWFWKRSRTALVITASVGFVFLLET